MTKLNRKLKHCFMWVFVGTFWLWGLNVGATEVESPGSPKKVESKDPGGAKKAEAKAKTNQEGVAAGDVEGGRVGGEGIEKGLGGGESGNLGAAPLKQKLKQTNSLDSSEEHEPGKSTAPPLDAQPLSAQPLDTVLTPEVVQKLSQEQLFEFLKRWSRDRKSIAMRHDSTSARRHYDLPRDVMGLLVSIIVPVVFFMCILGIVIGVLVYKARKDKQLQITLRAMVEKGAEIPPELIAPPAKKSNDRRRGILLLAAGLGISLGLAVIAFWDKEALAGSGMGLVLVFLGLGYLIVAGMEKKSDDMPSPESIATQVSAEVDLDRRNDG